MDGGWRTRATKPARRALFAAGVPGFNAGQVYAVTKDGQRFLANARPTAVTASPLTVVVNWTAAFQK